MKSTPKLRHLIAQMLIVTTTSAVAPTQAYAGLISTGSTSGGRERVLMLLDRPDVAAQLEAYGVKPSDAKARIAALNDAEAARLSADIDKALAGAGGGGGIITAAGVILVVAAVVVLLPIVFVGALVIAGVRGRGPTPIQTPPTETLHP
jgi:hypothetical protein